MQIEIIDKNFLIYRTNATGCFFLNIRTKEVQKLYNVEYSTPGQKDWALDETKTKIFFQGKNYEIFYMDLCDLKKKSGFYNQLELPMGYVEGVNYIKNIYKEFFIVTGSMEIFLIEKSKLLKKWEFDGVSLFLY